jgi:hypothetical protein
LRCRGMKARDDILVYIDIGVEQPHRPAGSLRSVAPPVFSFAPAVIITSEAPCRSA